MAKQKESDWQSTDTPPTLNGVYRRRIPDGREFDCFQYWNGEFWGTYSGSVQEAIRNKHNRSVLQKGKWKGLVDA